MSINKNVVDQTKIFLNNDLNCKVKFLTGVAVLKPPSYTIKRIETTYWWIFKDIEYQIEMDYFVLKNFKTFEDAYSMLILGKVNPMHINVDASCMYEGIHNGK